jgi:hypothetical protein
MKVYRRACGYGRAGARRGTASDQRVWQGRSGSKCLPKPAMLDKADRFFDAIFAETQQASNIGNAAMKYFKLE